MSAPDLPAADLLSDDAVVVVQERPVVPLSRWLAGVIGVAAPRRLQVVTPATSRITTVLESALRGAGGRWVVRSAGGGHYDGLRGDPLRWSGSAFVPTGGPAPAEYTTPTEPTGGLVRIRVAARHPATADLELGGLAAGLVERLTGAGPAGWGVAEPASEEWDTGELTRHFRDRMPGPAAVVLVGGGAAPALGTMTVSRRPSGIAEQLELAVGSTEAPDQDTLDQVARTLPVGAAVLQTMVVHLAPGRADCTVGPRRTGPPLPYGVLIGPEGVAAAGAGHALAAPAPHVELCGQQFLPSAWCRLMGAGDLPADPRRTLAAVLRHFGVPG
jgi:hypothetical protein